MGITLKDQEGYEAYCSRIRDLVASFDMEQAFSIAHPAPTEPSGNGASESKDDNEDDILNLFIL